MATTDPTPPLRRPRDPSALTSEYHKAHKQLLLWSGILFIWELIGVDLDKAKEVGGNVGAAVSILKSPQAVPWALVILVIYFTFKVAVEWNQNHEDRRKNNYARSDYISALSVAGIAVALYFAQTVNHLQVANTPTSGGAPWWLSAFLGFALPIALAALVQGLIGEKRVKLWVILSTTWVLTAIVFLVIGSRGTEPHWAWGYLGLVLYALAVGAMFYGYPKLIKRAEDKKRRDDAAAAAASSAATPSAATPSAETRKE